MVIDDPAEAARLVAAGQRVVLLVAEGTPRGAAGSRAGPGRLALFVGNPGDPAVRAAAEAMALELFGPDEAPPPPVS